MHSELTLDVLLTRVDTGAQLTVRTGIGQLPALHIGQRWQDQKVVDPAHAHEFRGVMDFSPENWRIISAGEQLPSTTGHNRRYLIPPYVYRLDAATLGSRCLGVHHDGVNDAVIIPCLEIARTWYLRSTALTLRLTSGPFPDAMKRWSMKHIHRMTTTATRGLFCARGYPAPMRPWPPCSRTIPLRERARRG